MIRWRRDRPWSAVRVQALPPRPTAEPPRHVGPLTVPARCYDWASEDDHDTC